MDTFEFDSDAFYICTEVSPRNFVVQKAIQIDKSQIERMVGKLDGKTAVVEKTSPSPESSAGTSSAHSPGMSPSTSVSGVSGIPQPPSLPHWFNRECKTTLMMVGPPPHGPNIPSSSTTFFNPPVPRLLTQDDIKLQLKNQLEYYFSRENLLTDRYLKCQMDQDHFVPINVVAGFPKVSRLTNDVQLIVEAVKDSINLELDENLEKVRAVSKRTTIIIREVPEEFREEVVRLLDNGPQFTELTYGLNDSWYVTYENELDTQVAYISVQRRKNELTQRPVCARIKAGGIPASIAPPPEVVSPEPVRLAATNNGEKGPSIQVLDPGQPLSLGEVGLIPVATYRPGDQVMTHYVTPTCSFSVNSYGLTQPMQAPQQSQSQQYFYPSSTSTTPRNFDEMSTASSNSTRTSSSNYNNRNGGNRNGGNGSYNNQYYESRHSFSNSSEWRPRGGGNLGGYQNNQHNNHRDSHQNSHQNNQQNSRHDNRHDSRHDNHQNNYQSNQQGNHQNHNEYTGRQNNSRGNWRNGMRNGTTNGTTHHHNSRQNGHQNTWRNDQNGHSTSTPHWQSNDAQSSSNSYNRSNSNYNNSYNKGGNNGYNNSHNHTYNNRYNSHLSSSSSSDVSSEHLSSEENKTPINSVPSTPSPPVKKQEEYRVPTPTDLPSPPVWPAPSFDRRRKSSEASSTTITTSTTTNTLTPSTPVTTFDNKPVFVQEDTLNLMKELNINENPKEKKEVNGVSYPKLPSKTEQRPVPVIEKEKVKTPPSTTKVKTPPVAVPTPSFDFGELAFPSLPKKIEPVKPPQKPTFR